MDLGLKGKAAVVVGADKPGGVARAIAEALAAEGVHIAVCGGDAAGLEETAAVLKGYAVEAYAIPGDISDAEEAEAMIDRAARLGGIDLLVYAPEGEWGGGPIAEYDPDDWQITLEFHLVGAFLATRYALPHLVNSGAGSIVNIASMAATRSCPAHSAYAAAMAGIAQFTRDTAAEYGPQGVRANCILAGDIRTDRFEAECRTLSALLGMSAEEVARMTADAAPLKRLGERDDIAALAVFLCSTPAAFLTGLSIPAAGGKDVLFQAR
ncbi:MAG: SDR family oxidoreductase [Candidatus Hydrogenedens sp.]|nr:SDR family oxidoreductase [Candidatus Hydrogenedens sp.]